MKFDKTTRLHDPDGKAVNVWVCDFCRRPAITGRAAQDCCPDRGCSACGDEREHKYRPLCDACTAEAQAAEIRAKLDAAEDVSDDWEDGRGMVYDHVSGEYHDSLETLRDRHSLDDGPIPEWAFGCDFESFSVSAEHVAEQADEDCGIGDAPGYDPGAHLGWSDFAKACEAFSEANSRRGTYSVNYGKKVRVPVD